MVERLLPPGVLSAASLQGNEYAWHLPDVEAAVTAAASCGLATLGGQVQFRTPDGTYELWWLCAESRPRRAGESWGAYVARSAAEVLAGFDTLRAGADFALEATRWPELARLLAQGSDPVRFLWFVLYFAPEPP